MRHQSNSNFKTATLAALITAGAGLLSGAFAAAETDADFANPAYAMTRDAVIASGTCIARYAGQLDDHSKSALEVGQLIAKRCAKEISRSAGLASFMTGKPEDFAKNVKYASEDLTTNAVLRVRASSSRSRTL